MKVCCRACKSTVYCTVNNVTWCSHKHLAGGCTKWDRDKCTSEAAVDGILCCKCIMKGEGRRYEDKENNQCECD